MSNGRGRESFAEAEDRLLRGLYNLGWAVSRVSLTPSAFSIADAKEKAAAQQALVFFRGRSAYLMKAGAEALDAAKAKVLFADIRETTADELAKLALDWSARL